MSYQRAAEFGVRPSSLPAISSLGLSFFPLLFFFSSISISSFLFPLFSSIWRGLLPPPAHSFSTWLPPHLPCLSLASPSSSFFTSPPDSLLLHSALALIFSFSHQSLFLSHILLHQPLLSNALLLPPLNSTRLWDKTTSYKEASGKDDDSVVSADNFK